MRSAAISSSTSVLCTSAAVVVTTAARSFATTAPRRQNERTYINVYQQQTFEHLQRMKNAPNYPGSIRAATPGDTNHYLRGNNMRIDPRDRQYWRPVVDDLYVEDTVSLRIRFKDQVWATNGWETRMHTIECPISRTATIAEVIRQVSINNRSPYLAQNPFVIQLEDKLLPLDKTVEECGLHDLSALYAVDTVEDHIDHLPEAQLKDWHADEITEADLKDSSKRYRDMVPFGEARMQPWYQASAGKKSWNFGRF